MGETDRMIRKRISRFENGFCKYCGENPPENELVGCRTCLDKKSLYNKGAVVVERRQQRRINLKNDVINKYGGVCSCCGESQILFLTIDHINNDGYLDKCVDMDFYQVLKRSDIRDDLQVMCFNCNCGKSLNNGVCPHKEINRKAIDFSDRRFGRKEHIWDKNTKINWPSDEELISMCNQSSLNKVSKILGVTRSTLSKRLKVRDKYHLVNIKTNMTPNKFRIDFLS